MANMNKLKGKIVENALSVTEIAKTLGMDRATFYRKMATGGQNFSVSDVKSIAEILKLEPAEACEIFLS